MGQGGPSVKVTKVGQRSCLLRRYKNMSIPKMVQRPVGSLFKVRDLDDPVSLKNKLYNCDGLPRGTTNVDK